MTIPWKASVMVASLAILSVGCAMVAPWDKDELGKPTMQFGGDDASQPFFAHALITNEEAEGGEGGSGGGCGCR